MNEELMVKGIETIIEGLNQLKNSMGTLHVPEETEDAPKTATSKAPKAKVTKQVEPEEEPEDVILGEEDEEEIDPSDMSFNELKSKAKELGLKAGGTKAELLDRILTALDSPEEVEDEKPAKKTSNVVQFKKKVDEPEAEEIEEDPFIAELVESVADLSNEDIASALSDVGIKPSGKREALIAKLAKAVKEGLIEFEDDGEEEPIEETEDTESEEEDDIINDLSNPDIPEARLEALKKFNKGIKILKKKTSLKEATELVGNFYETDDLEDDEIYDLFFEIKRTLIDDDGDSHDMEDAYYLNGYLACCASLLPENGECPVCGNVWEV